MTVDLARLVRVFIKMREAKAALTRKYDAEYKAIDDQQKRIEVALLKFLNDNPGSTSHATTDGTFYKQIHIKPSGADWEAFYDWMAEHKAFDFLERRLKVGEIKKYMEDNKDNEGNDGPPPPGVNVYREWVIRVRAPNEKPSREDD